MARIENLVLADSGRRRRAVLTLRGSLVWEASEASHNRLELRVSFFGQDSAEDDRLANNVVLVIKARSGNVEEGARSTWALTSVTPNADRL